jgi:hypothetical protein
VKIDTGGTRPRATLLANRLAREIAGLSDDEIGRILKVLDGALERGRRQAPEERAVEPDPPSLPA